MTTRRGFRPRFVLSRDASGTLRTVTMSGALDDPFPDDLRSPGGITFPHAADVILRQRRTDPTWTVEDRLQRRLLETTFGSLAEARPHAETLAASREGDLWVWSDATPRFGPVG